MSQTQKPPKKPLSKIKQGALSRGFSLARVSLSASAKAASFAVGTLFSSDEEKGERIRNLVRSQVDLLVNELGELKGSLMKVGQLLSTYGEHFLPPEANALLKSLQSESPPLEWKEIEKALVRQLGREKLALLEIDPEPIGSASLGQVHRAVRKSDGRKLALKIQYPGVDEAIDSDLRALRRILSVSKLIPSGPNYDQLFAEVRSMLVQEVDYRIELEATNRFRKLFANDPRIIVPETFPEFSSKRVLATSYEEGAAVDGPEVLALPLERRNQLGLLVMEHYFRELFEFGAVQTDPHFGNYRVRLGEGESPDQLVLFDFGAVRQFKPEFLEPYLEMVRGGLYRDVDQVKRGAMGLGFLREEDSGEDVRAFAELCFEIMEPFHSPSTPGVPTRLYDEQGRYKWGESDLPMRAARAGTSVAFAFRLRPPPREVVFLDRKMGGMFVFFSVLKCQFSGRELLERYLSRATR